MVPDEVLSIELIPFEGLVYNLSVKEDESYALNDIITHNCLCWKSAVLKEEDQFISELRSWVQGGSDPGLDNYASFLGVQKAEVPEVSLMGSLIAQALSIWLWGQATDILGRVTG